MEVVALISGGKDSCYSIMHCMQQGMKVVALANIQPETEGELDSFMYQCVGHEAIPLISQAIGIPLYQVSSKGVAMQRELFYEQTENDEIEDLYCLLLKVKNGHPNVQAVSSGAIMSNYQRLRVENVCTRLGLISLSFLWQLNQKELLHDMIESGIEAITIKIGSLGLRIDKHLGRPLRKLEAELSKLGEECELNVCGEGGEYETLTLDAPFFIKRVVIDKSEIVVCSNDGICPVAYIRINEMHLEEKVHAILPKIPFPSLLKNQTILFKDNSVLFLSSPMKCITAISPVVNGLKCVNGICLGEKYFGLSAVAFSEKGDIEEGVKTMMEHIELELVKHNHSWNQVIHSNLFVSNLDNFARINKVYCQYFHLKPPSRVCIQIPSPPRVICRLEIIGFNSEGTVTDCMHVQSRSYWAPENIGPYSQCYSVNNWVFTAGQIGLVPSEMVVSHSAIQPQLSLQHCQTILNANHSDVVCCTIGTCYGVSRNVLEHSKQVLEGLYCVEEVASRVVFVLVPRLPKIADCEWHFIALKRGTFLEYEKMQSRIDGSDSSTFFFTVFTSKINQGKSLTLHFCLRQDSKEFSFEILTNDLSNVMLKITELSPINSNGIATIRVWTVLRHPNLEGLISDSLKTVFCDNNVGTHQPIVCVYETSGILFSHNCILAMQALILQ